jgi:O-antigen ligase
MRTWPQRLVPATALLLSCAPLFVLALRGWTNAVLFLGALLALALLLWRGALPQAQLAPAERTWATVLMVALVAPLLAVALSAALRGDPYPGQFDAASRFVLGVPIFVFVLRARVDAARWLRRLLPLALLIALASLTWMGPAKRWGNGRDTTLVVDPLVFGYLSLAFGLMCLMTITPRLWKERQWAGLAWRVLGLVLGLYLSVRSGSRSGWLALPLVLAVWLHLHWGRAHRFGFLLVLGAALATPLLAYLAVPTVQLRAHQAWNEVATYPWTGVAPVTSVGLRVTFLRIAADTFVQHPWTGIGDTHRLPVALLPTFSYASADAVEGAFHAFFHNQLVTNAVRWGVGGFLATFALLFVPLALCARQLRRAGRITRENAALGFAYTLCIVVSSMSTEVVDLKFLASLYAVMVALLCGSALAAHERAAGPAS